MLADRAYTSETKRADDWIWPLWSLGFTSVHALTVNQLGPARKGVPKPASGALVVDGQPFSPRRPAHLRRIDPPKLGATRADITAYQALVEQRKLYALHAVGGRNADGSWDFGCRAMALLGQLRCDLKPASLGLPVTKPTTSPAVFAPPGKLPKVCGQEKARVAREELSYWQPDLHGSAQWYRSYNRRNRVEGSFGNLKNDAAQDITRGHTRVMGLAKTALMTMLAVMAVNLRLLDTFTARQQQGAEATPTVPVRRQPRRRSRLVEQTKSRLAAAAAVADAVASHAPPGHAPPGTDPPLT